jgi:polar amino acid transport system permease protein
VTALAELLPLLLRGAVVTVQVTVLAALLSIAVALAAGLGRLSSNRAARWASGIYIEIFRGTSGLVQMFWLFFALPMFGISFTPISAGVLALGLNVGSYGAEVVRGAVQAVPRGQTEAAIALNMTPRQRLRRVILPQAVPAMLPPFGNLMIELLKGTALVSLITISDLTFRAQQLRALTGRTTQIFTVVLVMYFVMAYAITLAVRWLERRAAIGRRVPKVETKLPEPVG